MAQSLNALIEALRRLPGVGVKSASRMAFHLLQHDREGAQMMAQALTQATASAAATLKFLRVMMVFFIGEILSFFGLGRA